MLSGQSNDYIIDEVTVTIRGSSSLHDWTVECGEVIEYPQEISLTQGTEGVLNNFGFKVAVKSMDGGRGASMNDKIYKALMSDSHPYISFAQTQPASYTLSDSGKINLQSTGLLKMAGQEKVINVSVTGLIEQNTLSFNGSHAMKLSEYAIDPPSAMFGQIQTKDDIFVHFEFRYKMKI